MPIEITMPRLSDTMQQGTIVKWNVKEGQVVKSGDTIADVETDKATMELQSFEDGTVARLAVAEGVTVPVGTVIVVLASASEDVAAVKAAGSSVGGSSASGSSAGGAGKLAVGGAGGGGGGEAKGNAAPSGGLAVIDPPHAVNGAGSNGAGSNGATSHDHATGGRVFASPLAKKIAAESNIDLGAIQGSGPSGRIIRKDVEDAMKGGVAMPPAIQAKSSVGPGTTKQTQTATSPMPAPMPAMGAVLQNKSVALSNMRRVIARRLVESKTTIPHYQVTLEVDMDPLMALRQQLNDQLASQGVKLSVNDFLVRACALAMHQHPYVNSRWVATAGNESVELLGAVNVGIAIALDESKGGGLVVATIRNADQIGLRQISSQSKQLAEKARTKGLSPDEMSDSTFTISNLGMFGVDHFTAIINPPNVAILAVGAAIEKPVVKNAQVVVGRVMSMTMSSDHRVVDGAMAAAYLNTVKTLLQAPATLLV